MLVTIDIGDSSVMLEYYSQQLEKIGLRPKFLYEDIFDCVRVKDGFHVEVNCLCYDIAFGEYFRYKYQKARQVINKEDFANTVKSACLSLYSVISGKGFYNEEGVFPYVFREYRCGLFYLRGV